MFKVWALWMVIMLPDGSLTQLRNNETFITQEECLHKGRVKAAEVAQSLADATGAPIAYEWACINEGRPT